MALPLLAPAPPCLKPLPNPQPCYPDLDPIYPTPNPRGHEEFYPNFWSCVGHTWTGLGAYFSITFNNMPSKMCSFAWQDAIFLLEAGLELWKATLQYAVNPSPHLLHCFENVQAPASVFLCNWNFVLDNHFSVYVGCQLITIPFNSFHFFFI